MSRVEFNPLNWLKSVLGISNREEDGRTSGEDTQVVQAATAGGGEGQTVASMRNNVATAGDLGDFEASVGMRGVGGHARVMVGGNVTAGPGGHRPNLPTIPTPPISSHPNVTAAGRFRRAGEALHPRPVQYR